VGNALALIEGVPLDKEKVPVNATDCKFGKWYHGDGQSLRDIAGFKEIDELHDDLHQIYMEIFAILFGEAYEPSLFAKLIGSSRKLAAQKREMAMEKFNFLQKKSDLIVKQIINLEKIITAMGEKQLEKYLS